MGLWHNMALHSDAAFGSTGKLGCYVSNTHRWNDILSLLVLSSSTQDDNRGE